MKKNKMNKLLILSAVTCMAFAGGVLSMNYANAAVTPVFDRLGASIKYKASENSSENGIRFGMYANAEMYEQFVSGVTETGMLIVPTDLLNGDLTLDNLGNAMKVVTYGKEESQANVEIGAWKLNEKTGNYESYVYVKGMPKTSYNRAMTAVGYLDLDGVGTGNATVYTDATNLSVSRVAMETKTLLDTEYENDKENQTYVAKTTELNDYLNEYNIKFFNDNGEQIGATQTVEYGQEFRFPEVSVPEGSVLEWYKRIGGTNEPIWSETPIDLKEESFTVTQNAQYKAHFVENVQYDTIIRNKENVYGGDPSIQYRDGYYYFVYEDSSSRLWILKSPSLEELLEGGTSGWGHSGKATCVYTPQRGDELGAELWAPELEYINGRWYIYVCGVPYGETYDGENMNMFVLECTSQDPTGKWKKPVLLSPKGFDDCYTIDGHAFEYQGQLYYVFSGKKTGGIFGWGDDKRAYLYMTKMSSPTVLTDDTPVKISQGSDLEEGPCTIVDDDDLYLMYSAGTWNGGDIATPSKDYHLEYYKLTGDNLLSSRSWTAKGICFQQDSSKDIYTVGHNHIFKNADGSLWTSYHGIVGTEDAGTDEYLAKRRVMVQPITIVNGELNFGGVQDTVAIVDKSGLQYNNEAKTEYLVDGYGSARLWENNGGSFTASTTITRLENGDDGKFCAGITLYERSGDGNLNKLLIGVEKEGNIFFCKDYSRTALYYKYEGWQWNNEGVVNLKVTYIAGDSTATSTIKIVVSNSNNSKSLTRTYTLDEINALTSDPINGESRAFSLHFTGDFEIGLGGNRNKCKFTNVFFDVESINDWTFVVNGSFTQTSETQVTIQNGAYLIPEAEIANWNNGNAGNVAASGDNWVNGGKQMNTKFSISTTIQANANENYKVGFVFTLNGTDYFTVVYNNEEKEIRVQASNGNYRDYGLGDTFNPAGTTMTLEYDGVQGLILYFGEGENKKVADLKNAWDLNGKPGIIFRFGYTPAADGGKGNNEHITTALVESSGTLKVGLVAMDGTATFMNTNVIIEGVSNENGWTPVFENTDAYCQESGNQVEINNGGYLIDGLEVTNWTSDVTGWPNGGPGQNTAFEVSTTVVANTTAKQFGFVLTTESGSRLQIMYNTETGRIRITDGTLYREYNVTAGLYQAGQSNTFTLKYDGSVYFEFLINGTSAVTNGWNTKYIHLRYGYDGDNSSGVGTTKTWNSLGSGNTLKVGLVATNGSATFTEWDFQLN